MTRLLASLTVAVLLLPGVSPAHAAASPDQAHRVLVMVYDIGLYNAELDRIMAEADGRGVYGGAGSTAAGRARDRAMTRATMLSQRDAVLNAATIKVAARATTPQLEALLRLAASPDAHVDQPLLDAAVSVVKAGFEETMWDQLSRTARGNAEFPCTKDQRSRC